MKRIAFFFFCIIKQLDTMCAHPSQNSTSPPILCDFKSIVCRKAFISSRNSNFGLIWQRVLYIINYNERGVGIWFEVTFGDSQANIQEIRPFNLSRFFFYIKPIPFIPMNIFSCNILAQKTLQTSLVHQAMVFLL